jgi:Xaa-Pro aminopeptidase
MTTTSASTRYADRLARARQELVARGIDALLLGPSADLRYLTGYAAPLLERLTMLVVPANGDPRLVVPALEAALAHEQLGDVPLEVVAWRETDDPVALVRAALDASAVLDVSGASGERRREVPASAPGDPAWPGGNPPVRGQRLAVGDRLWSTFLLRLQAAMPNASFTVASTVTRHLRMVKDEDELDALSRAAEAIDQVIEQLTELRWAGRSERDLAWELDQAIRAAGHDETCFVIVGSGPNSASPHHEPGDRVIQPGDVVVVDIGGRLDGYCSDTTRTLVVGEPPEGFLELYEALRYAQLAGCQAVRPGVAASAVDKACRDVIEQAGYGSYFIHRTGHGIGLEEHEDPYIVAGNDEPIAPGMAFSIEPGIYLPGKFGARIEDVVICPDPDLEPEPGPAGAQAGAFRLNRTSRKLRVVDA